MTTLICSGTLFSDWRNIIKRQVPTDSSELSAYAEISSLATEICRQQFSEPDELGWKPFTPENQFKDKANLLLSGVEAEPLFTWVDNSSCLYLNFWKIAAKNAKFLLFYSSPEFELSNYINSHPFHLTHIERVIDSWLIRTRAMLTFFMNNRNRSLLLGVQSAGSGNELFIRAINSQFDLDLEASPLDQCSLNKNSALIEYLATTLLLKNQHVSELYDEVLSAATLLGDEELSIPSIEERSSSLIEAFLTEVTTYKKLSDSRAELEAALSFKNLQANQLTEELEYYFNKCLEQEKITDSMADYLSHDPLLKIARQARQTQ